MISDHHISNRARRYRDHLWCNYIEPMRRDGLSDKKIAEELNHRRIPAFLTRSKWNKGRVGHLRRQQMCCI
jgi:hypothetical protein